MRLYDLFPKTIASDELICLSDDHINYIENLEWQNDFKSGLLSKNQNLLDEDIFSNVKLEIIELAEAYVQHAFEHVYDGLRIVNSWANVVGYNQNINIHRHSNSYISGCFYLGCGSDFVFYNIDDHSFSIKPESKNPSNPRVSPSFSISPERGKIIFFPSGLYHSVDTSLDDRNRYSVAFNIMPIGAIGSETNMLYLK